MKKSGRLLLPLFLILAFVCVSLALLFLTASPANAFLISDPKPTQENLWAHVNLAKPAYTATAITIPPESPTFVPVVTETPALLAMEIINEISTSLSNAPVPESSPPAPPSGSKYILVDISDQHMYVYENNVLVYSFVASTGINNATRVGTFAVQTKLDNAYGATWNIWMPNWLGIYYSGSLENGIHALPILSNGATLWEGFLGSPVSYGCVVLGTAESKLLYDWAEMGTPVEIQR